MRRYKKFNGYSEKNAQKIIVVPKKNIISVFMENNIENKRCNFARKRNILLHLKKEKEMAYSIVLN
jgi:hypothetical protein